MLIHLEEAGVEEHQHLEEAEGVEDHQPLEEAEGEGAAQRLPALVEVVVVVQHSQLDSDVPVEGAGEGCLKQAAVVGVGTEQRL